jgi:acid phosphatase class B
VEKTVLIITDGTESIKKTAETIGTSLKKYKVVSVDAKDFVGTQLLSADFYFFGTESPNPPSFSYLEKMLAHINLVNKSCGIFSPSQEAVDYLRGIVHDSELALYPEPYMGKGEINSWAEKVIINSNS